jgi:hypothetical protein
MQAYEPVIVCGGGAAGLAAALSAAHEGAEVCLIESRPVLGGTVAACQIHTLGGIYDSDGRMLHEHLVAELVARLQAADASTKPRRIGKTWILDAAPETYQAVIRDWIASTARIRVLCSTQFREIVMEGPRANWLHVHGPEGPITLRAASLIDATGGAAIIRRIDPALVQDDDTPAAGGSIFRLRGVASQALQFPRRLGLLRAVHEAARSGILPASCAHAWLDTGLQPDEVYVKLFVPLSGDWRAREERGEISQCAAETQRAVFAFLKALPEFAHAEMTYTGQLGIRDGGRVRGEYRLTIDDVRQGRQFPDAACRCAWPIEFWDSQSGLTLEYLSGPYDIPLRALKVQGLSNVWAAGKCLSADRWAQASARVVGTCWAMGEAVGKAVLQAR